MAATRQRRKGPRPGAAALLGLQKIELFKGLGSYSLREIAAHCRWITCRRNQYVVRRDAAEREVYFVIAGMLRASAAAALLAEHAAVRGRVLSALSGAVRELTERLLELGAQPVQHRVCVELLRRARDAGIADNRARLEPAPTHYDIAARVGSSREHVTRELSSLARRGILERAGRRLVLRDVAALEQLTGAAR
jgi:Crp-like helix-turn-helix domain